MLPALGYRTPVVVVAIVMAALSLWHDRSIESLSPFIIPTLAAPRPSIQTRAVPCVGEDVELLASGSAAVLCSSTGCVSVDKDSGDITASTRPAGVPMVQPTVQDGSICNGQSCVHLGRNLAAAIATATEMDVTSDLGAVIISRDSDGRPDDDGALLGRSTAWNVADDRPVRFWSRNTDTGPMSVVGEFLLVTWVHHDEGGRRSTELYDAHGGGLATDLDEHPAIGSVDHSLVVARTGHIALIDTITGKVTSQTSVDAQPVSSLVTLPDEQVSGFAVLRKTSPGKVVAVSTYSIIDGYLLADSDQQFPICAP